MDVIKITPRGYCYGVVDALTLARRTAQNESYPKPIYVLGQIVHNRHAVEDLAQYGIVTIDGEDRLALLEQVESGTVIFTAHGVSPEVRQRAREKGLHVVDATCPDVDRTHALIRRLAAAGYEILYIGRRGHPEPEGALGEAPGQVFLVERDEDLERFQPSSDKLAVTTQTTLSQWDTEALLTAIRERFPDIEVHNEICLATQLRQEAAVKQAEGADVVLVVGDTRSNNSGRLVQVVREIAGKPAYLVGTVDDIDPSWLKGKRVVGVTAGSSTPSPLTREVIRYCEAFDALPAL